MKNRYEIFRGDAEIIKGRFMPILKYIKKEDMAIDLGCGRGELLELFRDNGIKAIGVDNDPDMARICKEKGVNAACADIFEFLQRYKDKCDCIVANHIIEHLGGPEAERLMSCSYNSLSHGGKIIIVTPNAENLSVLSKSFWLDGSHLRPYPLLLLEKMLMDHGFTIVESGENVAAPLTRKLGRLRKIIGKRFLNIMGLGQLWENVYAPLDIFIVGEKR